MEREQEILERLVRIEEKIEFVLALIERQNGSLKDHEDRLRLLEKDRNKLLGIASSGLITAFLSLLKSIFWK